MGAVLMVVALIAITRGAWEVVVVSAVIAVLAGGFLERRRATRHGQDTDRGPAVGKRT